MREWKWVNRQRAGAAILCSVLMGLGGCLGVNTPGKVEWVQPTTSTSRAGTVYLFRGWQGIYSAGIDEIAKRLKADGVTAYVYMPEQFPEVAKAIVTKYKDAPNHEPICFVGHSRGVDSAIIVARELEKAGITVDAMCCLDSVDERTVPANVKVTYNYWMPGLFPGTNLLRGIPLQQEPGSPGKLYNYDMAGEYSSWKGPLTEHVSLDDDTMVQKRIVGNLIEACPERAKWAGTRGSTGSTANTPSTPPTRQ